MKIWVNSIEVAATAIIVDERKDNNKLMKLPFRNRSPSGQSPASKSRKSSAEVIPPYKDKDKKTWKGKVVNKLKRIGGGSRARTLPAARPAARPRAPSWPQQRLLHLLQPRRLPQRPKVRVAP